MIKKGTWVQLHSVILKPKERAPQVPGDTAKVPLEQWVKGRLMEDAEVGQTARAATRTGRLVTGALVKANPGFEHGFGAFVPELLAAQESILKAAGEEAPDA
ncbi:MAG: 2-amino-4-oxopentanoate thiolase subunit OrtA [Eubacteriales bacterium]|nr:2-amino-4-oxopentanoate thiolase subunit OrtA [Eubacteriales bacterium]